LVVVVVVGVVADGAKRNERCATDVDRWDGGDGA